MLRAIRYTADIRRPTADAAHLLLAITSRAVSKLKEDTPWLRRLTMLMLGAEPETYPGYEFAFWLLRRYNPWCPDIHEEIETAARFNDRERARAELSKWLEYVKSTLADEIDPRDAAWVDGLLTGLNDAGREP